MIDKRLIPEAPAPARPGSVRDRFERWALSCPDITNIDLDAIAYDPLDPDCHWIEGYYDDFTDGAYAAFKAIEKRMNIKIES